MSALEREIKDVLGKGCTICGNSSAKLLCVCKTTRYCSDTCQRVDWKARGHKMVCRKIRARAEAAAQHDDARRDAAQPDATPEEPLVFYGPAPRSRADEARARIAAAHEAARARREAQPEKAPLSTRFGSRCPVCLEDWDVNELGHFTRVCCCQRICKSCEDKLGKGPCPLCRTPLVKGPMTVSHLKRHIQDGVAEAMNCLGKLYSQHKLARDFDLVRSAKRAVRLWEKAMELGNVGAMYHLAVAYEDGDGVKLNKKKAMHFYRMAADRGCALSQTCLAEMLCESGNIKEAFRYIQLSAEQGFTVGELSLGECYWKGNSVKIDIDEARLWFMRAAGKGNERAKEHLAQIFRFLEESSDGDSDASWATVDE